MAVRNTKLAAYLLLAWLGICAASSGDRLPEYQSCTLLTAEKAMPVHLRLTRWTPREDCQYNCMQLLTANAIANGDWVHQFHGKWPFRRVWGMQEPASVLFSILNGWMHLRYFSILRQQIADRYWLKPYYRGLALVGMNAWLWSTVFHTRDFGWTEKLDYFSAGLYILYGLYLGVLRIFCIRSVRLLYAWAIFCGALFVGHVTYLSSRPRFDYGYNMTACIIIGVLQTSLWLWWSILQYTPWGQPRCRPYAWMAGVSVVLVSCAMGLEVFDFPPWYAALDAHSLWHAATIPLIPLFYRFLISDASAEMMDSAKRTT
ncbi:hypothetical protein DFQ29_002535 [Apophysomyces sp. BC1021]|nr:hypothetical protein DFQ29_002535 [Apophysomyces sp. BC1021]